MKHKKSTVLFVLLLFWGLAHGLAQQNTVTAGGDASGTDGTISYSIGQIDYIQATGSGGTANQGVQQPFEFYVLGTNNLPQIQLEVAIFPNPTTTNVQLQIGNFLMEDLHFALYDIHGRLLTHEAIRVETTKIPMEHLAAAVYVLHITQKGEHLKSFKIIKN